MSKYANLPIQVMESKDNGMQAIKLTDPPFDGIIYIYGKVELKEDESNDKLNLAFEYEILDHAGKAMTDMKPFESYIGKILEELIHIGVEENSITYTGGVDENRTKDSDESDT
jgi:hypothetical protein